MGRRILAALVAGATLSSVMTLLLAHDFDWPRSALSASKATQKNLQLYGEQIFNRLLQLSITAKKGGSVNIGYWEQVLINHAGRNYNLGHINNLARSHSVINRSLYYAAATSKLSDFSLQCCLCLTTEQS